MDLGASWCEAPAGKCKQMALNNEMNELSQTCNLNKHIRAPTISNTNNNINTI
jgi:hypothetical protein